MALFYPSTPPVEGFFLPNFCEFSQRRILLLLSELFLWGHTMSFPLAAYFERIDYQGPAEPTLAVLKQLMRLHTQRIPFENIDVLLQRPIHIAPDKVVDKLIHQQRGGYCFEQNGLMQQVLKALGFTVFSLGARVRLRQTDREQLPPRTHLFSAVKVEGKLWLVDVGFGALSLTTPLLWREGAVEHEQREPRRLVREGKRWFHQAWQEGDWRDVYEFTTEPMFVADQRVANWYTSTHPDSNFVQRLSVALALPEGGRVTLNDMTLRILRNGVPEERFRVGEAALGSVLAQHFGIHLSAAEVARLWAARSS